MSTYVFVSTADMSREEWLEQRRKGIGGSDAAALVGMNDYSTPWSIYADKKGILPPKPDTEPMRIGRDLEDYVAKRFTEASGFKVQRANAIYANDKYPYSLANIDRRIVGHSKCGLECKTTNAWNVKTYKNGSFPDRYYCQCVHYMAIMEYERWYLAVLVLGEGLHIYQMTRYEVDETPQWCEGSVYVDQGEIDALMGAEKAFWQDHILTNTPPAVDGEKATTEAVKAAASAGSREDTIDLGASPALQNWLNIDGQIKALKKEQEKWKQSIILSMMGARHGVSGKIKVDNVPASKKTFDPEKYKKDFPGADLAPYYKITTSTRFTVKEGK